MTSVSLTTTIAPTHILVLIASMAFPSGSNSQVRPKEVVLMKNEKMKFCDVIKMHSANGFYFMTPNGYLFLTTHEANGLV